MPDISKVPAKINIPNEALKRKIPTNGSYLQMIKSVPVAAYNKASPRYIYGINPKTAFRREPNFCGAKATRSCKAPKGHTPAQKVLPKKRVNKRGMAKNAITVIGIA